MQSRLKQRLIATCALLGFSSSVLAQSNPLPPQPAQWQLSHPANGMDTATYPGNLAIGGVITCGTGCSGDIQPNNFTSGYWYVPPLTIGVGGTNQTAGRQTCGPFVEFVPFTVVALGARVTTTGSSTIALGIYADGGGYPTTPIFTSNPVSDVVGVVTPTTYNVPSATLQQGILYWECTQFGSATTVVAAANEGTLFASMVGAASLANNLLGATQVGTYLYTGGQTVGTWNSFTQGSWTINNSATYPFPPLIAMQSQ